ncbi:MAG TPA: hypothetical protein VF427_06035 [Noviherbaspirillum sp.]
MARDGFPFSRRKLQSACAAANDGNAVRECIRVLAQFDLLADWKIGNAAGSPSMHMELRRLSRFCMVLIRQCFVGTLTSEKLIQTRQAAYSIYCCLFKLLHRSRQRELFDHTNYSSVSLPLQYGDPLQEIMTDAIIPHYAIDGCN